MAVYKGSSFQRLLKSLDPEGGAVLLYGPDAGLVAERAAAVARHLGGKQADQTEIVRLDERDLAEDPARLEVELRTIPMFAARKIVRVSASARIDVPALKALIGSPLAAALIVEAPALRPDSALRKLFERHPTAACVPCYGDERTVSDLIEEELDRAKLRIDAETGAYLARRLGADQALSRAEVAKLALYAAGEGEVSAADIDAVVGDSAEIAVETFVYAVSGGEAKQALGELSRLATAGSDPQAALSALGRHLMQLHRIAAAQASGSSVEQALRGLRPRPHFKREQAFIAHAKRLGARRLFEALPLVQETLKQARLNPELERALAEELVLALTSRKDGRSAA
jgi:DNA polymerase-3 subunit delta